MSKPGGPHIHGSSIPSVPFSLIFLEPWRGQIAVLFQARHSTVISSQYSDQLFLQNIVRESLF